MTEKTESTARPLVSVVIPVFNGATTIKRAVESVFTQTYSPLECVVVDDASTDSTAEILRSFGDRIRPVFNETNRGTAGAYNIGSQTADGEHLLLMASDCCLTDPEYIERAVAYMSDGEIGAVSGQGIFDDLGQLGTIQRLFTAVNLLDVVESDEELFEVSFIETRCDLVRKKALEDIGFWFEGLYNSTEDQDISARMRLKGYRLLQDKRLKFALDFGTTEDTLFKVIKKQYKYAHGQGYIFLKYGLGHHLMTGKQDNRRSRIIHRFVQILMGPIVIGALACAALGSGMILPLLALVALRAGHYWLNSRRWLSGIERLYCAGIGLACDVTYSLSFLSALVGWAIQEPSLIGLGKPALKDS